LDGASCLEGTDPARLIAFSKAMEFHDLTRRASAFVKMDPDSVAPDPRLAAKGIGIADVPPPQGDGGERSEPGGDDELDLFPSPARPSGFAGRPPSPAGPGIEVLTPEDLV